MSDERKKMDKKDLLERLDEWWSWWAGHVKGHDEPFFLRAEKAHQQIRHSIIQQKPEIDDVKKYTEEKIKELMSFPFDHELKDKMEKFVTQIISDVRGREVKMNRDDVDSFIRLFATFRGEERKQTIDDGIKYLAEKGVKIK